MVAVHGEIDAANADEFTDQLQGCADSCEWLALDLGSLEFIGTAGFAALRTLNTWFTKAEISWLLVPGTAVSRLLAVCDPDSDLPMAESIAHALTTLQNPRRLRPAPYPA